MPGGWHTDEPFRTNVELFCRCAILPAQCWTSAQWRIQTRCRLSVSQIGQLLCTHYEEGLQVLLLRWNSFDDWSISIKKGVVLMLSTGHSLLRRSTEVNWGQMRSMNFADFFRILPLSEVIWGAVFESDIHFTLRLLEIRSWNHRVITGQWRHMTRKRFF